MRSLTTLLLSFLSLLAISNAVNITNSSVFVYNNTQSGQQFVYALNIAKVDNSYDLYMHMSAPAGQSWMGVGIGNKMEGALMFIAYASSNGSGVTLSPRIATGHSEPSYTSNVTCELLYGDDLVGGNTVTSTGQYGLGGAITVNAVCHNATSWASVDTINQLNVDTTGQDFIFAVGPGSPGGANLQSDSLTAGIREHDFYGAFQMNTQQAVSTDGGAVPLPNGPGGNSYVRFAATEANNTHSDNNPAPAIHAFVMCLCFVILFPLGSLILRMLNRVILHAAVQTIALVLVTMASAGGIVISMNYNKSKNFASAHQIIGILLFLALIGQLSLGILNHRIYKREGRGTIMGKIHLYLGPAIILFGIINAPIGFVFAGNPHLCLPYVVILLMFVILYCTLRFCTRFCCGSKMRRKNQARQDGAPTPAGAGEGYQYPQFTPGPYQHPPPAYNGSGSEIYGHDQNIPLQPYESQQSGINANAPVYPRPMV